MGEHEDRILIGQRIAAARLARMRATHASMMQAAGVLDSLNAAAHGHAQRVSYEHYQLADTTPAAQAVGDMLAG